MNAFICHRCDRRSFSSRSHSQHLNRCPMEIRRSRSLAPIETLVNHSTHAPYRSLNNNPVEKALETQVHYIDNDSPVRFDENNISMEDSSLSQSIHCSTYTDRRSTGLLSSFTTSQVETYHSITNRDAGAILPQYSYKNTNMERLESSTGECNSENLKYFPFKNAAEYAFTQWLLDAECSRGDVERFFQDERLKTFWQNLSFQSADQWFRLINRIPFGPKEDRWEKIEFTLQKSSLAQPELPYSILYRDPIHSIRYLLGHKPFASNLAYTPIRQYYNNGEKLVRIYNELHTADWWWETQEKLPDGATIVPLLIATDKTQLTQHHGDRSAWPVYMTIGNLDRFTRRKQNSSTMMLIGHIPIISDNFSVKAEVYHRSMKFIFASMLYTIII